MDLGVGVEVWHKKGSAYIKGKITDFYYFKYREENYLRGLSASRQHTYKFTGLN